MQIMFLKVQGHETLYTFTQNLARGLHQKGSGFHFLLALVICVGHALLFFQIKVVPLLSTDTGLHGVIYYVLTHTAIQRWSSIAFS
jgi:hypothetical protein